MKKLLIAVPVISALFFNSCEKDPETIIETETVIVRDTITVTETVRDTVTENVIETVVKDNSVVITLFPIDQYYSTSSSTWLTPCFDFSVKNLGNKKITSITINFSAIDENGLPYNESGYLWDINIGSTDNGAKCIDLKGKKCISVSVISAEITTE